ncbi:winged helix-turn-helix domain-containing protein [Actinoplanes sp. NPDC049681]|uniref:winged helix-turn-helix domain-containing protein n=1 Tax=Actinoplanes sp. NPDC049681 TaxID=3363905 RepID=UPI0037BD6651
MAFLAATTDAEFASVRDTVGLTDSNLSKHATALEAAGYVTVRKGYVGRRPRTWLALTPAGRRALKSHVAALNAILADAGEELRRVDSNHHRTD